MSEYRKATTESPYFITMAVAGWVDALSRIEYKEIIIDALIYAQQNKGIHIYAYVIMPNHLHIIAQNGDARLMSWIRDFKSFTAKEILSLIDKNPKESRKEWMLYLFNYFANKQAQNKDYMFWQKTNHPIELYSHEVIQQKIDYIHNNPVKAGIVSEDWQYVYSSANPMSRLKVSTDI